MCVCVCVCVCVYHVIMNIHFQIFWVVTPCSVVVRYHCFGGPCCLHLQGEVVTPPDVTTQKTSTQMFTAVKTSNLEL
jgi:hypothetical protein